MAKIPVPSGDFPSDFRLSFGNRPYPPREFYILSLILQAPKDRAEAVLYRLGKDDFSDPRLREFFKRLKKYHRLTKRFRIRNFRAKIKGEKELVELLEDLVFQGSDFTFREGESDEELEVAFCKLKEDRARRRIRELGRLIREAEERGDNDRVVRLQEELKRNLSKLR